MSRAYKIGTPYYLDLHPLRRNLHVKPPAIEICIDCSSEELALQNAMASQRGGAHRLECCARMDVGGLTPDPRILERIRQALPDGPEVLSMIRPRAGDFEFSASEIQSMQEDIADAARAGADGVVIGALREGLPNPMALDALCTEATKHDLRVTFHRAFDAVTDRYEALGMLLRWPVQRILSGGTAWDGGEPATRGIPVLLDLQPLTGGRIEWVVGGGVGPENVGGLNQALGGLQPRSFHAYSSVITDGRTDARRVAAFVRAAGPTLL